MRTLLAAAVLLLVAGCTSSETTTRQTADGSGVAVARRGSVDVGENLGSALPIPPGAITIDYTHPQKITLTIGESRRFDLDVGASGYLHSLHLQHGSQPGIVRIDQTGATSDGEPLTGSITGDTPGTVALESQSENLEISFRFVLTVRVVAAP